MPFISSLQRARLLVVLIISFYMLLSVTPLLASNSSAKASPMPANNRPTLSGNVQFVSNPPKDHLNFAYAVLYVDAAGCCVNNTLPLRFDVDTRQFSNGIHTFKVVLFDAAGIPYPLQPFTVNINNTQSLAREPRTPSDPTANAQTRSTCVSTTTTVPTPTILYNNVPFTFPIAPFIIEGRTMSLLRPIIEAAGGTLSWQGDTGTGSIGTHRLLFTLNSNQAKIDDKSVTLLRPVIMLQQRIFAPVTLWRDLLGAPMTYEHKTRSIWLGAYSASPAPAEHEK